MSELATAETADVGSNTEGASAPEVGDSPAPQEEQTSQDQDEAEVIPFHKHPRWEKINQSNRELRERVQTYESQMRNLEGARALEQAISRNPTYGKILQGVLQGLDPQSLVKQFAEPQKDPYAEWEPEVAERFKKLDALEQWKAEQEQGRVQEQQRAADRELDTLLQKDGYLDAEGNPVDESMVNMVANGVLAWLMNNSKNWQAPSTDELHFAYKQCSEAIKYIQGTSQKQALKNIVKKEVPASGSKKGAPPAGKTARSDEDRLADLMNSI